MPQNTILCTFYKAHRLLTRKFSSMAKLDAFIAKHNITQYMLDDSDITHLVIDESAY